MLDPVLDTAPSILLYLPIFMNSKAIMQLLRDNLTLWTSDMQNPGSSLGWSLEEVLDRWRLVCWKDPKKWEATSCEGWVITHNTTEAYFIASCKRVTGGPVLQELSWYGNHGSDSVTRLPSRDHPPWWNFTMTSRLNCLTHGMSFRIVSFLQGCFCETQCMKITFGVSGVSL